MPTPFIAFLGPSQLDGLQRGARRDAQPKNIPQTFLDAMEVREKAFVEEHNITTEKEFDVEDPRCCHWVLYASVKTITQHEIVNKEGYVIQPKKSESATVPIGTIRLVPFPNKPHPKKNGQYRDGLLKGEAVEKKGDIAPKTDIPKIFGADRATAFHDGQEPYVKLSRLAVLREYRDPKFGNIAAQLVNTAINWITSNPAYFDPSVKELGLRQLGAITDKDIPKWNGLICVHTQANGTEFWKAWGFEVDKELGEWYVDGVPYVGMFARFADRIKEPHWI